MTASRAADFTAGRSSAYQRPTSASTSTAAVIRARGSRRGSRGSCSIRLADRAGQQTFDVRGSQTVRVRLTVDSAYGTGKGRRVAIAEVEFFGHRS
ncbi:hypothetical protein [Streptomyces sp. NPDC086838]|uniref:hypothetical protein n=1 Tax=Streptomyces sp. NPDC086838 TaxID=3365762 RepID=UPI00380E58A1